LLRRSAASFDSLDDAGAEVESGQNVASGFFAEIDREAIVVTSAAAGDRSCDARPADLCGVNDAVVERAWVAVVTFLSRCATCSNRWEGARAGRLPGWDETDVVGARVEIIAVGGRRAALLDR
jgi:hypothetical protein